MTLLIQDTVIQLEDFSLDSYRLRDFNLSRGEWINIVIRDERFARLFSDALLLKSDAFADKLFKGNAIEKGTRGKQALRRRISYLTPEMFNYVNEQYISTKEKLTGHKRSTLSSKVRTFLDFLMISEDMPLKYKHVLYALFMNGPELLVIHNAISGMDDTLRSRFLSYISRFAQKSGMAIINICTNAALFEQFKGREFRLEGKTLSEVMHH